MQVSERTSKVTTVFSNGTPSEQDRAIQDLDKKMTQNVANFVAKVKVCFYFILVESLPYHCKCRVKRLNPMKWRVFIFPL